MLVVEVERWEVERSERELSELELRESESWELESWELELRELDEVDGRDPLSLSDELLLLDCRWLLVLGRDADDSPPSPLWRTLIEPSLPMRTDWLRPSEVVRVAVNPCSSRDSVLVPDSSVRLRVVGPREPCVCPVDDPERCCGTAEEPPCRFAGVRVLGCGAADDPDRVDGRLLFDEVPLSLVVA